VAARVAAAGWRAGVTRSISVSATTAPTRVTLAPIVRPVPSAETKASRVTAATCAPVWLGTAPEPRALAIVERTACETWGSP